MIVASVLKSGGSYSPAHVDRLNKQVKTHTDCRFVCLSDVPVNVERIPLIHDFKGWWSKLELFRDIWDEPVVYLDLDVTVRGDISGFVRERLTLAADFMTDRVNSSVMAWTDTPTFLYRAFIESPQHHMGQHTRWPNIGDQSFIESQTSPDRFPRDWVASFKVDGLDNEAPIVAYHGRVKPWH